MRWMTPIAVVSALAVTGCSGLIEKAPAFLPTLERCQDVVYERHGTKARATVDNCTVPVGELAR